MRCTHCTVIAAAIIGNTFAPLLLHLTIYLYAKGVDEIQTVCIGQQNKRNLYCPGQVCMGTRSSSTTNWGWVVARRRCLNGQLSPVSCQGVPNQAALSLRLCFIDPAWQWRKLYCGRMQTDPWPLCQASTVFLAVCKFNIAIEERCEQGYGWNVRNFAASCHGALNTLDDCSYVYELSWPMFDPLSKNLAW